MKPRLALFLSRLSIYGGVEKFGYRLAEALAKEGYEVDFVCTRCECEPPDGVRAVCVGRPWLFRSLKILWFLLAGEYVRRKNRYDLTMGMSNSVNMDILRISGGPVSIFFRLSVRAYPKGLPRIFKRIKRWLAPHHHLVRLIQAVQSRGDAELVTVSHRSREWLREGLPGFRDREIRVIYNQPDLKGFSPGTGEQRSAARKEYGLKQDEVAVAFAGTAFARKGLMPLIRAMALLPDNFRLLVAGGRRPGAYAALARELGISGRVDFLGAVQDMAGFYRAADLLALPSFYDTCANAVPEALASGLPVAGSVDDGSSHFLPEDWRINNPEDEKEIARVVFALSKEERRTFNWPADVDCGLEPYLAMIREALESKS